MPILSSNLQDVSCPSSLLADGLASLFTENISKEREFLPAPITSLNLPISVPKCSCHWVDSHCLSPRHTPSPHFCFRSHPLCLCKDITVTVTSLSPVGCPSPQLPLTVKLSGRVLYPCSPLPPASVELLLNTPARLLFPPLQQLVNIPSNLHAGYICGPTVLDVQWYLMHLVTAFLVSRFPYFLGHYCQFSLAFLGAPS